MALHQCVGKTLGDLKVLGVKDIPGTPYSLLRGLRGTDPVELRVLNHTLKSPAPSEYSTWMSMIARCSKVTTVGYAEYGGRGIRVCPEWSSFATFLADMGPRPSSHHSLDRVDVDGNYEPSNCRWATVLEQARNRRDNLYLTYQGETLSLAEWAERLELPQGRLRNRVNQGLPVELILQTGRLPCKGGPRGRQRYRGVCHLPEYKAWKALVQRCTNPDHPAYAGCGGRGIQLHSAWFDFHAFQTDLGPCPEGHQLTRQDPNGDYTPDNCFWATKDAAGKLARSARKLEYGGRTLCLSEWSQVTGLPVETIRSRLRMGWALGQALGFERRQVPV